MDIEISGQDLPGRRRLLKAAAAGLLALLAAPALGLSGAGAQGLNADSGKVLVVYYSRSGNTRAVAEQIHALVGGDIVEVQTVEPYPEEYRAVTQQARQELDSGFRPALKTSVDNLADYAVVLLGSPCWWGTLATPMLAFLENADLSGKAVGVFVTHEGSGLGRSLEDLRAFCPTATLLEGFAVRGRRALAAQNEVAAWLRKIRLID